MPTREQLEHYAEQLSPIYREIMAAFPRIEPTRKRGYGLAIQTISMRFSNEGKSFGISEIQRAVEKLREGGFVEVKNGFFVHPTDIGEGLVESRGSAVV